MMPLCWCLGLFYCSEVPVLAYSLLDVLFQQGEVALKTRGFEGELLFALLSKGHEFDFILLVARCSGAMHFRAGHKCGTRATTRRAGKSMSSHVECTSLAIMM
eukprot:3576461-Amphidinium_carterae.1